MSDHFDVIRPDTLLWALGAFAEPEPDPRECRIARIRKLRTETTLTDREIGEVLGISTTYVRVLAFYNGLPKRMVMPKPSVFAAQNAIIRDLYATGMRFREIGSRVGLATAAVQNRVYRMGLARRRAMRSAQPRSAQLMAGR